MSDQVGHGFGTWRTYWPDKKHYVNEHTVRRVQLDTFSALIFDRASERRIEKFLGAHFEVLAQLLSLYDTGHYAAWIYPKRQLRPRSDAPGGLIPDYLMAGANSFGVQWVVVELKGANHSAFVKQGKRVFLSAEANKGVCQLINYLDVGAKTQSYLRDELGLKGFREPRGVLVIGTEDESNDEQIMAFKAAWNKTTNDRVQVRSYHALLRCVHSKVRHLERLKTPGRPEAGL